MVKARAVRKEFLNNPKAKPLLIAKKYGMILTDVYYYRKQVREFLEGKQGFIINKGGALLRQDNAQPVEVVAKPVEVYKAKIGRPRKVQAVTLRTTEVKTTPEAKPSVISFDKVLNKLVADNKLDYKRAYAVELLTKNKVKEAISVLTDK